MSRYIIRRLLFSIPVLVVASMLVFVVVKTSTNPLAGLRQNPRFTEKDIARLTHDLGLDQSGIKQYTTWVSHFVRGNWGVSPVSQISVFDQIRTALVNSAILGLVGTAFSLVIGVGIGVYSSLRQYSKFDNLATTTAFIGISMPNFWFALLLQIFFGVYLVRWFHLSNPIFYTAGMYTPGSTHFDLLDRVRHIVLPAMVLSVQIIAVYSRYMRASMLEVLHSDFLRTARAKGLRERRVVFRHAMRNALIPITTQLALDIGAIAAGLIITETIFSWPGMGPLFINAMNQSDYPVALAWVMVTVFSVIIFNLIADIMYAVLDPRIRYA